jgi:hypothetical protein
LGADLALQISQLEGKTTATKKNGQERTIKTVAKQIEEIEKVVASDQARRNQVQQIQRRVASITQEIARLQKEIMTVEGSNVARQKTIRQARLDTYEKLFQSWKKEQAVLEGLYEPVRSKLQQGLKEEKMLDFHINWDVDVENWLDRGNELFDQRKGHPFGSPLKFRQAVQSTVLAGWETGDPHEIKAGMEKLLDLLVGGPGVKPGFAASDAAVLFGYTTHPWNSRRESNPDLFVRTEASSCLRPREPTNVEGMQRIEL